MIAPRSVGGRMLVASEALSVRGRTAGVLMQVAEEPKESQHSQMG